MAARNLFWSAVWSSPLKEELSEIQMQGLKMGFIIGHGAFGDVVTITDKKTNTVYAGRKVPELSLNKSTRKYACKSFAEVTRQLCNVHHSNIVQLHGVFFSDGVSYFPVLVYENAVDCTLECYLLDENRREREKTTILQHVASGLEYLHDQKPQILHLNLTCANVFVSQSGPSKLPTAKIADAGVTILAKVGNSEQVKPRTFDYLPSGEEELEWNAKLDVLCYGVLMGHVILQKSIVKTLPIFFGDEVSDIDGVACHLLERLQVHPLYPIMQSCLNRRNRLRPTSGHIRKQVYSHENEVLLWDQKIQTEARDWVKGCFELNIMITGRTGSGKTSLINGLVGKQVEEARHRPEGHKLERGTSHVGVQEFSFNSMVVRIWDTPGFEDGTGEDGRYLDEMKMSCSDCNLYIYCISMSNKRLDASDNLTIAKLTEGFGKHFWAKVLFVLTFANIESTSCPEKCDTVDWFEKRVNKWRAIIAEKLIEYGVEKELAENIEVIPAGYSKALEKNPDPWVLPGIQNWFHNFWYKCTEVMDQRGLPALVGINLRRLKDPDDITKEALKYCVVEDHPIPIQRRVSNTSLQLVDTATGRPGGIMRSASIVGVLASQTSTAGSTADGMLGTAVIDPIEVSLYWKQSASKISKW